MTDGYLINLESLEIRMGLQSLLGGVSFEHLHIQFKINFVWVTQNKFLLNLSNNAKGCIRKNYLYDLFHNEEQ
jgi:hypothetical protein